MSRRFLVVAGLSAFATLGLGGVLATTTDTATTGDNHIETPALSPPEPPADALLLHQPATTDAPCPTDPTLYSPDLVTAPFAIDADTPRVKVFGDAYSEQGARSSLCVMNTATAALDIGIGIPNTTEHPFVDVEVTCGPGEADVDTTCTPGAAGELSQFIGIEAFLFDSTCRTQTGPWSYLPPSSYRSTYVQLGSLSAGSVGCLRLAVADGTPFYDTDHIAQSDRLAWVFELRGTEP